MTPEQAELRIQALNNELMRERKARKRVEDVLRNKAVREQQINSYLSSMTSRLKLALQSNKQVVWEYVPEQDHYYVFKEISHEQASVSQSGTFDQVVESYHADDRSEFCRLWDAHINGKAKRINHILRRFSRSHQAYRWVQVTGKKLVDEANKSIIKVVGVYKDVHEQYTKEQMLTVVGDAFLKSAVPSVIIDYAEQQVVVSDSFLNAVKQYLSTSEFDYSQQALFKMLPVENIQTSMAKNISTVEDALLVDNIIVRVKIKLPGLLQPRLESGQYRYAVALFTFL